MLAPGTELLGAYQGSGRIDAPFLLRRADGRMLEVSWLLHLVATHLDGAYDLGEVARKVGVEAGRPISADSVGYLVEHKLRPLGVLDEACRPPARTPRPPVLSIAVRAGVVPPRMVRAATRLLLPLFHPLVVGACLAGLVAVDGRLLSRHGAGVLSGVGALAHHPPLLLAVLGITLAAGLFHELGHATASRYGGAEPGVIGVGVYLLWPVFYNDLNDSYRLSRRGRLRADLGGVYFNVVAVLLLAGVHAATGAQMLLVAIVVQHIAVAQQFVPFLRLDGYYLVSDLAGVPDLFGRVRPVLAGLFRGRARGAAAADLTPRARAVVTVWVVTTVPLLVGGGALLVVRLPSFLSGAAVALGAAGVTLRDAVAAHDLVGAALGTTQVLALAVPFVGLSVLAGRALGGAYRRLRRGSGAPGHAAGDLLDVAPAEPPVPAQRDEARQHALRSPAADGLG